ncbi:RHS repeat-associated core domain-containing protein [Oscillospiraceae bacterium 44-34]
MDLVKRYATHDYDSVLELYYAKARFYDAHDRQFTAVDPILDPSGYDLREYVENPVQLVQYLYVENNSIIYIDPSGESIAAAAGTVVVYAGKAFAVGLVAWLFTPSGKEAIDNASMLMADGIVYMGNEIPAFAYRVTSGVIGFVGQLIIETPSSFEPKEMLTGVVNGAKIAETVGYMAKVACEGKSESDSNTQSGKSDSESNSNRKQPSTSNSLGTPKGDGGNGGKPVSPTPDPDDTYKPPKGGGGVTDTIMVGDTQVDFGHGGRHLEGTGLSMRKVNDTIAKDVITKTFNHGNFTTGDVIVDGVQIHYTAFKLADKLIKVGTYYIPK